MDNGSQPQLVLANDECRRLLLAVPVANRERAFNILANGVVAPASGVDIGTLADQFVQLTTRRAGIGRQQVLESFGMIRAQDRENRLELHDRLELWRSGGYERTGKFLRMASSHVPFVLLSYVSRHTSFDS